LRQIDAATHVLSTFSDIRYDTHLGCGEEISKAAATTTAMLKFKLLAL